MLNPDTYTVEFTKDEIWSLNEILAEFRKTYQDEKDPTEHALFVAAAKLHYKLSVDIANANYPGEEHSVKLEDFMVA